MQGGVSVNKLSIITMKEKIFTSFNKIIADIPDGSVIMISGFAGPGTPRNLINALAKTKTTNLTIICNTPGRWGDTRMDVGTLISNGQVSKVMTAFTSSPHPSITSPFNELYKQGKIDAELIPQGSLAERIRAAGAGIPAFYTPTGIGTEIAEGKETRFFGSQEYVMETALYADYALIRSRYSDNLGNTQFHRTQRNFGPIMAKAAKTTIMEVDEPLLNAGEIDPDFVHLPGIFVDRLIHVGKNGIAERPPVNE